MRRWALVTSLRLGPPDSNWLEVSSPFSNSRALVERDSIVKLLLGKKSSSESDLIELGLLSDANNADNLSTALFERIERWRDRGWSAALDWYLWSRSPNYLDEGQEAGAPLEHPAEERSIFVADAGADFVDGAIAGFQQALRFLDPQVLHVVDQRQSGRLLEPPFQRPLGHAGLAHGSRDDAAMAEVPAEPGFARPDYGVAVGKRPYQRLVRKLALVVKLQQINLRDSHRLAGTGMP